MLVYCQKKTNKKKTYKNHIILIRLLLTHPRFNLVYFCHIKYLSFYQPKQLWVQIWTACVVMKAKVETFKKSRGIWTVENWLTSPLLLVEWSHHLKHITTTHFCILSFHQLHQEFDSIFFCIYIYFLNIQHFSRIFCHCTYLQWCKEIQIWMN